MASSDRLGSKEPGSSEKACQPATPDDIFESHAGSIAISSENVGPDMGTLGFGPTSLGPVQMYACHESRELALTRYELAFGGVVIILIGDIVRRNGMRQFHLVERSTNRAEKPIDRNGRGGGCGKEGFG